jgi:hypothetical protein
VSTTKGITDRARFLYHAAPQPYADFLVAFADYVSQQTNNLIDTTENIQRAQGQAQQCKALLNALKEATKNG